MLLEKEYCLTRLVRNHILPNVINPLNLFLTHFLYYTYILELHYAVKGNPLEAFFPRVEKITYCHF